MNRSNGVARHFSLVVVLFGISTLLSSDAIAQNGPTPNNKAIPLVGRVIADVASFALGAGLGPQYQKFVFGVESKNALGERAVSPVTILYAFFKDEGPLPDSFFNHWTRYELNVVRDPRCDQSVSELSYEKNVDTTGKELSPTNVLQILYGAAPDVPKPDLVPPCYVLQGPKYRIVSQDADRITSCQVRVPPELQDATFTVVYKFETKGGQPINITRVKNDSLRDDGFTACISRWTVPSLHMGFAKFAWSADDSWTTNVLGENNDTADAATSNIPWARSGQRHETDSDRGSYLALR